VSEEQLQHILEEITSSIEHLEARVTRLEELSSFRVSGLGEGMEYNRTVHNG